MSKTMMIKELIPTFFVQLEKRIMDKAGQLSFSFCQSCGSYVQPEHVQIVDGKPLCRECAGQQQSDDVEAFEREYRL